MLVLVSDLWEGLVFRAWAENSFQSLNQSDCQTWLWAYTEWRKICESRTSQRSQFLVLTLRSMASGDDNEKNCIKLLVFSLKYFQVVHYSGFFISGRMLNMYVGCVWFCDGVYNGLFQKKSAPPRRMGSFFNPPPLSPGFPEAQDPPSCLDFQDKRPPLLPGFPGKIIRLKFNLFFIENTHNHIQKMFFFNF